VPIAPCFRSDTSRYSLSIFTLYGWILVPIAVAIAIFVLYTTIFWDRYLIGILPAVFILIAMFVTVLFRHPAVRAAAVAVLVIPSLGRLDEISEPRWPNQLGSAFDSYHELA